METGSGRYVFSYPYAPIGCSPTQFAYGLCMAAKTISIETDVYELLGRVKKDRAESFSDVIRRLFAERPALTADELLDVMNDFRGNGAGPRRRKR
jgi:predicted CopG family antitoxin